MQLTVFQTFDVPGAASALTRSLAIARGTSVPVRALVRNVGAVPLFVAGSSEDVVNPEGPSSNTYRLDADASDSFILAPGQLLYCVGSVAGGLVSVSVSEALPLV